jgi:hypothetical protein
MTAPNIAYVMRNALMRHLLREGPVITSVLRLNLRVGLVALAYSLLMPPSLGAQEVTGSIHGRVVSPAGQSAEGVRVAITGVQLLGVRMAETNRDGYFHVPALPPGEYLVRVSRIGMQPVVFEHVNVAIGHATPLTVSLKPATVRLEEVRIVAGAQTIDPAHTDVGATIDAADYVNLPGERDYKSMIGIISHVTESYRGDPLNVAGATGLENRYFIDGANVTDPLKGQTGTSLPYNFIRQVEVKTGGYEAQYGRALGAIVNAVTYSGTNDFEINMFGFGTHSVMSATPRAEPTLHETAAWTYDVGARVGGPVVHDRLWYSAAYNPRVQRATREIGTLGAFEDRSTAQLFAGKLTWQTNSATLMELSVFGDPAVRTAVMEPIAILTAGYRPLAPDPYLLRQETGGIVASLNASSTFTDRVRLDASVSLARGRNNSAGATRSEPLFIDEVERTIAGGVPLNDRSTLERSIGTLRGTADLGRHTTIAGLEYEDANAARGFRDAQTWRAESSLYHAHAETQDVFRFHNRSPTAYLQDSWRVVDRLTLNAGIRWSSQTLTTGRGAVAQRFDGQWQPRVGFIWQPGVAQRQRIFGSWGRFYLEEPVHMSTFWFVDWTSADSTYDVDPRTPGAKPAGGTAEHYSESDFANTPGLTPENTDELTVGYERLFRKTEKFTARGIRRVLRSSFQWAFGPNGPVIGTPGEGKLDFLPRPVREYTGLELALAGAWKGAAYRTSYVLSRNYGNYSGLYDSDYGISTPGGVRTLMTPYQAANSSGLLANDRTHQFKLSASRPWRFGLSSGAVFSAASGSPLNKFARGPSPRPRLYTFVVPRGSAGRTPAVWNLDLRFAQTVTHARGQRRIVLDILHVGNPQRPVWLDELAVLDGGAANASYGTARSYQPPMMARLGLETSY